MGKKLVLVIKNLTILKFFSSKNMKVPSVTFWYIDPWDIFEKQPPNGPLDFVASAKKFLK